MSRSLALAVTALLFAAAPAAAAPAGAAIRLNQIQVVGTHNSYHVEASPPEKAMRAGSGLVDETMFEYSFPPLPWQFGKDDVRQIELDLWADPQGGRYAAPRLRSLAGEGPYAAAMQRPGIKVLHVQDYDYRSTCLTFVECLRAVRGWSDGHPGHVPIAILLELKDQALPPVVPATVPLPWNRARMRAIDREIRSVFPRRRIITPDDVRGRRGTLAAAVRRDGWPTLESSRGKVLFLMDNAEPYRTRYLALHPGLRRGLLFTDSAPGQPDAAFAVVDDPTGAGTARIRTLVRRGFLVRTRADADTREARTNDVARRNAAFASGAQFVSTDYPAPGMAARFGSDYVVQLRGGRAARCDPVTAPPGCRAVDLDRAG